jgi:CBS domain-containing protein
MYEFLKYLVRDVMTEDVVVVGPNTPIRKLEEIFDERDFNGVPVLSDSGEVVGIVTKLDILGAFRFTEEHMVPHYEEIAQQPASGVMSEAFHTVTPHTPLTRVLEKLVATRVKSYPVVDEGRLVGIVSREDVLRALRAAAAGRTPAG